MFHRLRTLFNPRHDLAAIYHKVNITYFEGKLHLPCRWSGSHRRPRSRFRLGSYNLRTQSIKIHRILSSPCIPEYLVAFILYHEMLHHVLPPIQKSPRRRSIHHPAFLQREKQFQEYTAAQQFLKKLSSYGWP